jgi:hypothetical protein
MPHHAQKTGRLHLCAYTHKVEYGENLRSERLADLMAGEMAFLTQDNAKTKAREQARDRGAGWSTSGDDDVGSCGYLRVHDHKT